MNGFLGGRFVGGVNGSLGESFVGLMIRWLNCSLGE